MFYCCQDISRKKNLPKLTMHEPDTSRKLHTTSHYPYPAAEPSSPLGNCRRPGQPPFTLPPPCRLSISPPTMQKNCLCRKGDGHLQLQSSAPPFPWTPRNDIDYSSWKHKFFLMNLPERCNHTPMPVQPARIAARSFGADQHLAVSPFPHRIQLHISRERYRVSCAAERASFPEWIPAW